MRLTTEVKSTSLGGTVLLKERALNSELILSHIIYEATLYMTRLRAIHLTFSDELKVTYLFEKRVS